MFNVKNKVNLKKICMTVLSLSMIFAMLTPNFASADGFKITIEPLEITGITILQDEPVSSKIKNLYLKVDDQFIKIPKNFLGIKEFQAYATQELWDYLSEFAKGLAPQLEIEELNLEIYGDVKFTLKNDDSLMFPLERFFYTRAKLCKICMNFLS